MAESDVVKASAHGRFPAIRVLDDGCMGCNQSVVACDAARHHGSKCCGFCDHKAAL